MTKVVWKTPAPSSSFEPEIEIRFAPGRNMILSFGYETPTGMRIGELRFDQVVSYEQVFLPALTLEMSGVYYDQLCEVENGARLKSALSANRLEGRQNQLKNYRIKFDDGPYFDILCRSFSWEERPA